MIKILHLYKSYYKSIGGIEKFIQNIVNYDAHNQHDVACISNKTGIIKSNNNKIYIFKKSFQIASNPFSLDMFLNMNELIKKYDLIHFHYPYPTIDIFSFLRLSFRYDTKKLIITYHSDIVRQKFLEINYSFFRRSFFKNAALILSTSDKYIKGSYLYPKISKIPYFSIPIGIEKNKSSKIFNKKLPQKFFLFVGAHRYYKGLFILLKSFQSINIPLVIAGSGPETKKLLQFKNNHKIKNIIFVGTVSDAEKNYLYENCYAFIFPSNMRSEAFGIALVEAFSFKKAAITSDIDSGMNFININKYTGLYFKNNDYDDLKDKITFLFNNEKLNRIYGINAYKRYKNLFSIEPFIKNYQNIYSFFDYYSVNKYSFSIVLYKLEDEGKKIFYELICNITKLDNTTIFLIINNPEINLDFSILTKFRNIKIIFSKKNFGFGRAHNLVLKYIKNKSKVHFILNPDIILDKKTSLTKIFNLFNNEKVIHLTPKIIDFNGKPYSSIRPFPSAFDLIKRRFFQRFYKEYAYNHDMKFFSNHCYSGCFLVIKTDKLISLNGFDERFFLYMEDMDLIRRLNKFGPVLYYPNYVISHFHNKGSYYSNWLLYLHCKSAIKYFIKWNNFIKNYD